MNTEISRLVEFDDAIETARNAHDLYDLDVIVSAISDLWIVQESITSDDRSTAQWLRLSIRLADSAKPVRRIKIDASPLEALRLMQLLHHAGVSILRTSPDQHGLKPQTTH